MAKVWLGKWVWDAKIRKKFSLGQDMVTVRKRLWLKRNHEQVVLRHYNDAVFILLKTGPATYCF